MLVILNERKYFKVLPLYYNEDITSDYRPRSTLPIVSGIIETVIFLKTTL